MISFLRIWLTELKTQTDWSLLLYWINLYKIVKMIFIKRHASKWTSGLVLIWFLTHHKFNLFKFSLEFGKSSAPKKFGNKGLEFDEKYSSVSLTKDFVTYAFWRWLQQASILCLRTCVASFSISSNLGIGNFSWRGVR